MPDHFGDQLAPGPALMAAADATTALRVGALVLDNDFRHPVVLAKELATIDLLCDGRLEVGLGAGWMRTDYEASGLAYDEARIRIDRMVESLAILKALFADGPVSFSGKHYTVDGLEGWPKPVQRPGPPLLLGGGGRRVLTIAAREADIVGINGTLTTGVIGPEALASMMASAVDAKIGWVRDAAGARLADIELNVRAFFVSVTNDRAATADAVATGLRVDATDVLESPFALIGTTEQIAETLMARRERWGLSYVIVGPEDVDSFAPVVSQLAGR
jgi:probable F420-dependent oxidoreductase